MILAEIAARRRQLLESAVFVLNSQSGPMNTDVEE
jgi:hypothetical protein